MKNKVALVTGGTGGIGTAICRYLKEQGAHVVAGYNNGGNSEKANTWQKKQKEEGYDFSIVYGDVTNDDSTKKMVQEIESKVGPIDILINNAGITADSTCRKMTLEQWDNVIKTNLDSVFIMTRHVLLGMIERKYGRIVNISSVNGQKGQFGQVNYSAAKAGMHGFTKALAQEVAKSGITVNTVSPGYVATDMVKKIAPEIIEKIVTQIPVGRLAEPAEIARLVGFLVAEASGFITGANFSINGGQHMY